MMAELEDHAVWHEPLIGALFGGFYYGLVHNAHRASEEFVLGSRRGVWLKGIRSFFLDGANARFPGFAPKGFLVVKEPNGSVGAPLLMEALPESRMILLLRDPRDVAASGMDALGARSGWATTEIGLDQAPAVTVEHWAYLHQLHAGNAAKAYKTHSGRKVLVRYEDLVADTPGTTEPRPGQARRRPKKQNRQPEQMQERSSNKGQRIERLREQLSKKDQQARLLNQRLTAKDQELAELYTRNNTMVRETMDRPDYKAVWTASSQTRRQATMAVMGDGDADEQSLIDLGEKTRRQLETTVGINPDDVILEIGCGVGRVGRVLAPRCKRWIGCDVSPNMLDHARERLASFGNASFVEVSGFDLSPVEDASVDLVYCTVVFMHLDEWDRYNYVLEAHRVLRPGGRIFVDNFNLRSDEGWEVFEGARQIAPEDRPPHIGKASTPQELEVYLRRGGFQEVRTLESKLWAQAYGVKGSNDEGAAVPNSDRRLHSNDA
jgi:ubiquinone/menaquinone biosynthesis C-methylase UbiE